MTLLADPGTVDLNGWLDRVPRLTIDVGPRRLPVFRSLGILGFQVALVWAVLVALVSGLPLVTALGLSAVAGLSFFAWGLLRRALTGSEVLVLVEYVWVAFLAVGGFLWASGGPVVLGWDVISVAICWFLAAGRLGCLTVGCCHGVPARVGIRHPPEHDLPPRVAGRRLLPVQLIEALGLVGIGLVGLPMAAGPPGRATVWFLAAYAVLRFGTESLRGDRRPAVLGVSVPRAMCSVQLGASVVAAEAWLVPGPPGRTVVVGGAALLAAGVAGLGLTAARGRDPLTTPDHLDETWTTIALLSSDARGGDPATARTSSDMTIAVSAVDSATLHVSLSHPRLATTGVGVALLPHELVERGRVTHAVIDHRTPAAVVTTAPPAPDRGAGSWAAAFPSDDSAAYFDRPRTGSPS